MIEPEMAFYDITDNMDLAEDFVKYCITYALDHCRDDIDFLAQMYDKDLVERLQFVVHNDFVRLTYTEGVDILLKSGKSLNSLYIGAQTCRAARTLPCRGTLPQARHPHRLSERDKGILHEAEP